ncbi:MAG: PHP domain-containing protein [Candidatus Omnitrophica bacterium]|nr:PHP domain-containing protein [Candidatus Omnitrophota bacterium]
MKFADLHLHTTYSDSTLEPEALIRQAQAVGLDCISVVDHDTVDGIYPTQEAAKSKGIEVIAGIELSCEYNNSEVHILGYLIDYTDGNFLHKLSSIRKIRQERIYQMVDKLKDLNVSIEPEEVFKLSKTNSIGRLHLAQALVKKGYVTSIIEAFQRYIGDGAPAYVCGFKLTPQEAINLILSVKGIPVLAHPYTLGNDGLILKFIEYGLRGIEVYYPEHTKSKTLFYENFAKEYGLLSTGGSDYHGLVKPEISIGCVKIPYELVEKLKEEKQRFI